jgi:hypothetical protein
VRAAVQGEEEEKKVTREGKPRHQDVNAQGQTKTWRKAGSQLVNSQLAKSFP